MCTRQSQGDRTPVVFFVRTLGRAEGSLLWFRGQASWKQAME